jgi:hypothetical protein
MSLQKICYQCDYGDRTKLKEPIRELTTNYSHVDLGIIPFVNNNPYQLEFYIIVEFEKKEFEKDIRKILEPFVIKELTSVSALYLFQHMIGRRFNSINHIFPDQVDMFFKDFFFFNERKYMREIGYTFDTSMFPPNTVFFSYSDIPKKEIETIYSYLIGNDLPIFFDLTSMVSSDILDEKIQESIQDSKGIVFFVNQKFIDSTWCMEEEKLALDLKKKVLYIIDNNLNNIDKFNNVLHIKQNFQEFDYQLISAEILKVFL